MKLYPNLIKAVIQCLQLTFGENKYADKVIEKCLKANPKWGSRDRAFVAQTVYDMVRHWRWLWYQSDLEPTLGEHKLWILFGIYWKFLQNNPLPNDWKEFKKVPQQLKPTAEKAVELSIPDWLDKIGTEELGGLWAAEIKALNQQADVILRTNTIKTTREEIIASFEEHNLSAEPMLETPEGIKLLERRNIFNTPLFMQGFYEVQDIASQQVAHFLDLKPGHKVIDACAGAGGKTLHMGALLENKGQIIAMDIEAWKLDELKKRMKRAGLFNILTKPINKEHLKQYQGFADRLLLDVPCSGLGVLRRNPDSKWKLSLDYINELKVKQAQILQDYSQLVKVGGILVYATCSILPSENNLQVEHFLNNNPNFEFLDDKKIFCSINQSDGFYMAKLKRNS